MVDDESKPERRPQKHMQSPSKWDLRHNPAYNYYCFYIYANLYVLNKLREARGLNTFSFRPHAGEPSSGFSTRRRQRSLQDLTPLMLQCHVERIPRKLNRSAVD